MRDPDYGHHASDTNTQTGLFTFYTGDEAMQLLTLADFRQTGFETKMNIPCTGISALAQ